MTDATPSPLPTTADDDAERYDSPRDRRAREKGLPGSHIEGGGDPNLREAQVEDRRLTRWLIIMVATIVGAGFVIGTILALIGSGG